MMRTACSFFAIFSIEHIKIVIMIEAKGPDIMIDSNGHGFELDANRI
jgi:hypothetical protein